MKEMDSQSKPSLKLQAYQYLKTKILNCEYRPNEFLNEQKLCAEMGNISSSRSPPCSAATPPPRKSPAVPPRAATLPTLTTPARWTAWPLPAAPPRAMT